MTLRRAALAIAVIAGCAGCLSRCVRHDPWSDPANELPFGKIDVPVESAHVQARTPVAGWALDDRGIREIRLYVDGRFAALGAMKEPRPDVRLAFPEYARGRDRHGWRAAVSFAEPGPHTILVQAEDTDGATRDIGTVTVIAVDR